MNNWRLLLFAILCIFQPISSEENIFNGREQCHPQRSDSSRKDTRISPYEYLTTPSSEIRRVNARKEIREISEQRLTEQDFSRTRRQFTSHREGISQDVRETNRRIRTNDRVSLVSRQGYDAETVSQRSERRSLSRNDRTESQIRNIREGRRTDTDILIRDRRITSKQETNARSFRSLEINENNRRTYEREVTGARITSSRNAESSNVPARRSFIQREYIQNVQRQPVQNVRLERNVNKILKQREFVQIDEDKSRNLKGELKAIRVNANDRMNLEASRRNTERIVPQNLRDIRQNQRPNVRVIRTNSVNTDSFRSADVIDNRRNDIRRSITEFRRQDTDRKVRNDVNRLELETRVRRDIDTDRKNNRDEQIRQNKVDVRDATVSFVRREERPSLRTNMRDSRTENRDRELNRDLVIRSQRRLSLERHNKIIREFSTRNTQIKNSDFNRIINERIRLVPIKQTDDNDRRETNVLRQRNLEGFRNIKQDNRQRNTLENSQRLDSMSNRFRQNVERDNGQRLRSIEAIRVTRDDATRENIRRSITLNDRFSNKMVRDESTRSYRTNEFSTETRSVASENYFTFELQYLFYIIQAVYLIGIFRKLPQNKQGFEKKSWFGSWKTPIVMKMD